MDLDAGRGARFLEFGSGMTACYGYLPFVRMCVPKTVLEWYSCVCKYIYAHFSRLPVGLTSACLSVLEQVLVPATFPSGYLDVCLSSDSITSKPGGDDQLLIHTQKSH